MTIQFGEANPDLERARRLTARCRPRAALRACELALKEDPHNPHAIALEARLRAGLKLRSIDESKAVLDRLISEHSDDTYLLVGRATLTLTKGDRANAISELEGVAADHPEDPYVHQVLAGLLGCERSSWPDAWEHYKLALRDGPLLSTTYKAAAYYLSRRLEPALARLPLEGSSGMEPLVIRTRAQNFRLMFLAFYALAIVGALVGSKQLALGLLLSSMATAWALWCAFANFYIGCWKCFLVWFGSAFAIWAIFAWVHADPIMGFLIGFGGLIGGLIGSRKPRRAQTSERQATR